MVGGGAAGGAGGARRRWETQQGGLRVAALSTSREVPTQGIDRRLLSFAVHNKRRCEALAKYESNYSAWSLFFPDSPVAVVFLPAGKHLMNLYPSL